MCYVNGVKYPSADDAEMVHLHMRTLVVAFVALVILVAVAA